MSSDSSASPGIEAARLATLPGRLHTPDSSGPPATRPPDACFRGVPAVTRRAWSGLLQPSSIECNFMSQPTSQITDAAPMTSRMKPEHNRGVRCICFVLLHSVFFTSCFFALRHAWHSTARASPIVSWYVGEATHIRRIRLVPLMHTELEHRRAPRIR